MVQQIISVEQVIAHVRERKYMGGIDRDKARVKATEEVFTPTSLVQFVLDKIEQFYPDIFKDPNRKVVDSTGCGDGQILGEVLIKKMQNGIDFETALGSIYGVDIMEDNVLMCKQRLLCGQQQFKHIVDNNIVHSSFLDYDFGFGKDFDPYDLGGLFEQVSTVSNSVVDPTKSTVNKAVSNKVATTLDDLME